MSVDGPQVTCEDPPVSSPTLVLEQTVKVSNTRDLIFYWLGNIKYSSHPLISLIYPFSDLIRSLLDPHESRYGDASVHWSPLFELEIWVQRSRLFTPNLIHWIPYFDSVHYLKHMYAHRQVHVDTYTDTQIHTSYFSIWVPFYLFSWVLYFWVFTFTRRPY